MTFQLLRQEKGFTLVEVLLVMAILAAIVMLFSSYIIRNNQQARIDKVVTQMQQILNAAQAYYIKNGKWPPDDTTGTLPGLLGVYLPNQPLVTPWNTTYSIATANVSWSNQDYVRPFSVYTTIGNASDSSWGIKNTYTYAQMIVNKLPLGTLASAWPTGYGACFSSSPTCQVVGMVNVPAQSLNAANGLRYAGVFHHGACVPVPTCPVYVPTLWVITNSNVNFGMSTMAAMAIVVPVSIAGYADAGSRNMYPISSVRAYVTGGSDSAPPPCYGATTTSYPSSYSNDCEANANTLNVGPSPLAGPNGGTPRYWRACVQIETERGGLTDNARTDLWGQYVELAVFTRCAINNEPAGSPFTVYSN